MIKMYINNEEVVSNKEFTISEEMLATPSTILNNCYPALWENTKDYVSKFYFPKDYSKCIIGDGEFEKGSQRNIIKKVSGISPSFETNITKPWESLTIDGKSTQETTTGKNLFNESIMPTNTIRGIKWEYTNKKIKISGTATSTYSQSGNISITLQAGTYYFVKSGTTNLKFNAWFYNIDGKLIANSKLNNPFTISENATRIVLFVEGITNGTSYNQEMNFMVSTTNGNYEPYTGGQPSPSPDYPQEIKTIENSLKITSCNKNILKLGIGSINTNNTALTINNNILNFKSTGETYWVSYGIDNHLRSANYGDYITWGGQVLKAGTYTLTYKYLSGSTTTSTIASNFLNISVYGRSVGDIDRVKTRLCRAYVKNTSSSVTFTINEDKEINAVIYLYASKATIDINFQIQLEKGPTATNYEPYTEQVVNIDLKGNELCSLPNGTKDELIVKNGRAKIIKKIGKVVLDGSENWSAYTNTDTQGNTYGYNISLSLQPLQETHVNNFALSNYFMQQRREAVSVVDTQGIYLGSGKTMFIKIAQNLISGGTLSNFKAWSSAHNTTVQYELAEPYEIDLGEVTLPNTLIGQNNVTLDATLETNMEISYYYSSYDLLFAGVVKKTGNISLNPRYPHYADIQVLDFKTFLSEGETLNFVIDNKTIGQAIDMVIDAIKSYGFVKGNIMLDDINEVIGAYSTDKKTAYDVFQYFSDITNSRWFTRMIDEDTVAIDFYDTDKLPVKPKIEYTEDWFCNNLIDDMSYSIKTDDYRNKQILLSDEVFGSTPYNDLLTSNGYDTSYTTTGKIASLTSAKIDGKNATFTTEANKEGGVEADIYYKPGEVGITTNNQVGAGKVIEITYIPLVEGREIIINDEEVNRIGSQLNRNGVISRYENRNDTTSSDELRQIGQTYIKYKGKAEVTLKITSRKNIYDIGDKVQFDAPLEDLSTEYMVKKKTTKYIVTANQLFYDYELSSSFNSESEINYFDNQRSKHKGNLSEGDYITRDIDITNSANIIWHDTSIDEISITGNNILDCALDSPFTD